MTIPDTTNPTAERATRNGVVLRIGPARPEDAGDLRDFFRHVTATDLRFRFLGTVKEIGEEQIAAMTTATDSSATLLARVPEGELVAIATLAGEPGGEEAEVALSIRPEWKHRGVSWTLLEYVLDFARAHGFRLVSSLDSAENREAIELEREMGFVIRLSSAAPVEILAIKSLGDA